MYRKLIAASLLIGMILITSCSMKTTHLSVLKPGQLDLPGEINTMATMDRSIPPKGLSGVLEGAVTGEGIGEDRAGRQQAMEGVTASLRHSPRYEVIATGIEQKKERSANDFDSPLSEEVVSGICEEHSADALVVLEYFDTDHSKDVSMHQEKRKAEDGSVIPLNYYVSNISTRVQLGWRLYYKNGRILDEHSVEEQENYSGRGNSEEEAIQNLPTRRENIIHASRSAGISYGARIAPLPEDLQRTYFVKASDPWKDKMEEASRAVEAGRWDEAAQTWKTIYYKADDQQTKGRTAFNLAVAGEINGQLETAKYWAEEAWIKHELKKAKPYINTLKHRMKEQDRLEKQLREETEE